MIAISNNWRGAGNNNCRRQIWINRRAWYIQEDNSNRDNNSKQIIKKTKTFLCIVSCHCCGFFSALAKNKTYMSLLIYSFLFTITTYVAIACDPSSRFLFLSVLVAYGFLFFSVNSAVVCYFCKFLVDTRVLAPFYSRFSPRSP